jgi:hydrogenase maturation protease
VTAAGGTPVVVIGVGNEFRRDDGIGPEVLSRLRDHLRTDPNAGAGAMVRLVHSDGEPASLIEAWTGASLAVVVDAVVADPPCPGRVHRIAVGRDEVLAGHAVSSHGLGVGQAISLAAALGRMPDHLVIHAVQAGDVGHGVGLTPAVSAAAAVVTAAVLRDVQAAAMGSCSAREWAASPDESGGQTGRDLA